MPNATDKPPINTIRALYPEHWASEPNDMFLSTALCLMSFISISTTGSCKLVKDIPWPKRQDTVFFVTLSDHLKQYSIEWRKLIGLKILPLQLLLQNLQNIAVTAMIKAAFLVHLLLALIYKNKKYYLIYCYQNIYSTCTTEPPNWRGKN